MAIFARGAQPTGRTRLIVAEYDVDGSNLPADPELMFNLEQGYKKGDHPHTASAPRAAHCSLLDSVWAAQGTLEAVAEMEVGGDDGEEWDGQPPLAEERWRPGRAVPVSAAPVRRAAVKAPAVPRLLLEATHHLDTEPAEEDESAFLKAPRRHVAARGPTAFWNTLEVFSETGVALLRIAFYFGLFTLSISILILFEADRIERDRLKAVAVRE